MSRRERIVWACAVVAVGLASGLISWRVGRDSGFELQKQFFLGMLNDEIDSRQPRRERSWSQVAETQQFKLELGAVAPHVLTAARNPRHAANAHILGWWEQNRPRYVHAMGESAVEDLIPSSEIPSP